jgi:Rod binding domain-containing protein
MIDAAAPAAPVQAPAGPKLEELRKVAQGFESIFMQMLFRSMRSTVNESKLFHGGRGEEVFRDMLDQQLVGGGSGKGLGIADMIVGRYGALVKEAGEAGKGTRIDLRVGT